MSDVDPVAGCSLAEARPLPRTRRVLQVVVAVGVVAAGAGAMVLLRSMKKAPARREVAPVVRKVRVVRVQPSDRAVVVTGHGTARAAYRIPLVPEVGGRVVKVAHCLKAGRRVARGTVLLEIEPDSYQNALDRAQAEVKRLEAQVQRLEKNLVYDRARLEVAERSRDLARKEFDRLKRLLAQEAVGSEAGVENAERVYLERQREVITLENSIAVQPIQVAEARQALAAARAQEAQAALDLRRTRVTAPFDARVERADVQIGQVVGAGRAGVGASVAVLTDLRVLEIPVALDNTEIRWLPIAGVTEKGEYRFDPQAGVEIFWVQDSRHGVWKGRISRLERFEPETRTITLVVEVVDNRPVLPRSGRLQLEEGMFCRVEIAGVAAKNAFAVPRALVRRDRTVAVLAGGKLALKPVHVLRFQGDLALLDRGLESGDRVVLTPIANPVPGMALVAIGEARTGAEGGPEARRPRDTQP